MIQDLHGDKPHDPQLLSQPEAATPPLPEAATPQLYLLTGGRQCGKSSWLKTLLADARRKNQLVSGLLTPAVFEDGRKVGIDGLILPQGEAFRLADLGQAQYRSEEDAQAGQYKTATKMPWVFHAAAVERINQHFSAWTPQNPAPGLMLVDELGWMEFNDGGGFVQAMRVLDQGAFRRAIAVIRPELLEAARKRWEPLLGAENLQVITIEESWEC